MEINDHKTVFDAFAELQGEEGKLHRAVEAKPTQDLSAAHTPGPWRVVDADDSPDEWSIRAGDDWRICTVHGYCGANETLENEESDANARLIAAAPALYESASRTLTALRQMRDSNTLAWDLAVTPEMCNAWDDLRAALALATKP